jgi:hypothetical protein
VSDFASVPFDYEPHAAQRALHRMRGTRILSAVSGRRGGKSYGGAAEFADRILDDTEDKLAGRGLWAGEGPAEPWSPGPGKDPEPFLRYGLVAPTYALLDEPKINLRKVLRRIEEGGLIVDQIGNEAWLAGGVRIDQLSGDRPERLVSHGYNGLWLDEAARLKAAVWRDNLRPTLSDTLGWAIFTTTPLGRNWFWEDVFAPGDPAAAADLALAVGKDVADVLDPTYGAISWTTADNTALPHLAAEMEEARRQMPEALWRRNYLASFDAFEGQIFDLLAQEHLRPSTLVLSPLALSRRSAGLDLGWTHPSALALVGRTTDGRWHDVGCVARSGVLPHSDSAWVQRDHGDETVWTTIAYSAMRRAFGVDGWRTTPIHLPADRPDVKRMFADCGFWVVDAYQAHEPAVTWTQIALHNRQLTIGSPVLWRCLSGLHYPAGGARSTKLWVAEDDDPWDAFRYALSDPIRNGDLAAVPLLKTWMRR